MRKQRRKKTSLIASRSRRERNTRADRRRRNRRPKKDPEKNEIHPQTRAQIAQSDWSKARKKLMRRNYKFRPFDGPPEVLSLPGSFGVEADLESFLNVAEQAVDSNSRYFQIDFSLAERVWPSGVTLLASLLFWWRLTSKYFGTQPRVGTSTSLSKTVEAYLQFCGLNNFILRAQTVHGETFEFGQVVPLIRQKTKSDCEHVHDELFQLVEKYSTLSAEALEYFNCVVLSEIFSNVTEHGMALHEQGWYAIAQYHPTTGIVSICIADNGIGIRNSLETGPQRLQLKKYFQGKEAKDHDFISISLLGNVSGAEDASLRQPGKFLGIGSQFERGDRRGNGLKRIAARCKLAQIEWAVLSGKGYNYYAANGNTKYGGSREGRIFPGTLYFLRIPARKEIV